MPGGSERKLARDDVVALGLMVDERPDATLEELMALMAKQRRVSVSISTISRRLIELGLTRKKVDSCQRSRTTRGRPRASPLPPPARHSSGLATDFFIDETGINLSMTWAYARALIGERAVDAVPKCWGDNITVTAALTLDGIVAPMMMHGAMTSCVFEGYVERWLLPERSQETLWSSTDSMLTRPKSYASESKRKAHASSSSRLLARLQSHRARLVEAEGVASLGRRAHGPEVAPRASLGPPRNQQQRRPWLVRTAASAFHVSESRW